MLHYIYTRPLIAIILFMVLAFFILSGSAAHITAKRWRRGNFILAVLMAETILYATIFNRLEGSTGTYSILPRMLTTS